MYKIEIYYCTVVGNIFFQQWLLEPGRVTYQEIGLGENVGDFYVKQKRIERKKWFSKIVSP